MALVARVPVICEDSFHYADLAEAVDLVAYEEIPARIRQVVSNVTLQREMVARQNAFVDRWSEQETQECMPICMLACVCVCVCVYAYAYACMHGRLAACVQSRLAQVRASIISAWVGGRHQRQHVHLHTPLHASMNRLTCMPHWRVLPVCLT